MKLNLYSLLFAAAELSLLVTRSNAFYTEDSLEDMFRRDSGLNVLPDHYLRSFHDSPLADISTRELVYELESRLERRETHAKDAGNTKKNGGNGDAATDKKADANQDGGPTIEPTVELLNKGLKKVLASKVQSIKDAAQKIRQKIKAKGGVPFDEAAGANKGGAAQGGGANAGAGAVRVGGK